ncbi:hypothetical protein [Vibrio cholerae]|uniref:hypothetical protein n=1 Tax=Vibrio cholerae TaxID=666 RepID=UPI000E0B8704|nr:hypothetical protein [Vibrio cholerae]
MTTKNIIRFSFRVLPYAISLLFLTLFFLDLNSFKLWPQVTDLWHEEYEIQNALIHPHGLRYTLVYPIFYLANTLSVDYDSLFSIFACFLIGFSTFLIVKLLAFFGGQSKEKLFMISLLLVFIFINVNGRGVFTFLSSSLLLYAIYAVEGKIRFYIISFCSFLLSSFSSGTIILFILWFFSYWILLKRKSGKEVIISSLLFFYFFYIINDYVVLILNKNLNYFGGGFAGMVNMLEHGLGKIFFIGSDVLALILMNCIIFTFNLYFLLVGNFRVSLTKIILISSGLICGLFGITTALYLLPLIILIMLSCVANERNTKFGCDPRINR